jgi:hypothetical protein
MHVRTSPALQRQTGEGGDVGAKRILINPNLSIPSTRLSVKKKGLHAITNLEIKQSQQPTGWPYLDSPISEPAPTASQGKRSKRIAALPSQVLAMTTTIITTIITTIFHQANVNIAPFPRSRTRPSGD